MAHGFIDKGEQTTFATKKELAWHKLGKVVDAMTSEQAIVLGGLNFEVGLAKLRAEFPDTEATRFAGQNQVALSDLPIIKDNFATYRKDTNKVFGIVGNKYQPIQNIEAFDFFDNIIGQGHAQYETVGALGNGEKIFITAKLPSKMIIKNDEIDKYLLLTTSHDGSGAIQIIFTPIRVVCNNTLSIALQGATNKISIRHTQSAHHKLQYAERCIAMANKQSISMEEAFNYFTTKSLNDNQIEDILIKAFGFEVGEDGQFSTRANNIIESVIEYHEVGVGQSNIRGTAWGVFNALTGYQQNVKEYRDLDLKFENLLNTTQAKIRQNLFDELLILT